jgi:hypothetical protein
MSNQPGFPTSAGPSAGASNVQNATFQPEPFSLTGEALLFYCQSQLNSIDSEVKTLMDQQRLAIAKKSILNQLANTMSQNASPKTKEAFKNVGEAFDTALAELKALGLPPGDPTVAGVLKLGSALFEHYQLFAGAPGAHAFDSWKKSGPNGQIPTESFAKVLEKVVCNADLEPYQGFVGDAKGLVEDLSANAEMNMIQIQAAMSKRQTVVQLTTNMMSKMDNTLAAIVANFK